MTELTGGRAFSVENLNDLPDIAAKIGAELPNQYILGYHPSKSRSRRPLAQDQDQGTGRQGPSASQRLSKDGLLRPQPVGLTNILVSNSFSPACPRSFEIQSRVTISETFRRFETLIQFNGTPLFGIRGHPEIATEASLVSPGGEIRDPRGAKRLGRCSASHSKLTGEFENDENDKSHARGGRVRGIYSREPELRLRPRLCFLRRRPPSMRRTRIRRATSRRKKSMLARAKTRARARAVARPIARRSPSNISKPVSSCMEGRVLVPGPLFPRPSKVVGPPEKSRNSR
jgi:hypothetical protein